MTEIKNHYFKEGHGLMSGLPAPYREAHFIRCDFHPNTFDLPFQDCIFEDCSITPEDIPQAKDCLFM